MIEFLKNLLDKSFWPLIGCYGLYILYEIYSYFTGLKYVVNKEIYHQWLMEKMITVGLIIGLSLILKVLGKTQIASLVLGVPAIYKIVTFFLVILIWLFLAAAMIIFGKS
jgi:hypothetical protein